MFEILFKYPISLFQKGHFVFLTPWPLWLMAAGILVAAGMLFWHIHRNHGMLSGARPIAIWLLETAMAALLLFVLWHPALSVATLKPQQNVIAVLVDNSRTMGIADSSGTREAAAATVVKSLLPSLADRFQVRLYEFGKEPDYGGGAGHAHRRHPGKPACRIVFAAIGRGGAAERRSR
jgi:hypothetical protein